MKKKSELHHRPYKPTHPGVALLDELNARGITIEQFSQQTGLHVCVLSEIVKCNKPITFTVATAIENTLGISKEYWLNFQAQYNKDSKKI